MIDIGAASHHPDTEGGETSRACLHAKVPEYEKKSGKENALLKGAYSHVRDLLDGPEGATDRSRASGGVSSCPPERYQYTTLIAPFWCKKNRCIMSPGHQWT